MTLTNETFEALLRRAREVAAQVLHSAEQIDQRGRPGAVCLPRIRHDDGRRHGRRVALGVRHCSLQRQH